MVCVMENAIPHGYICYNFSCRHPTFELSTKHYRMFWDYIVNIRRGHTLWAPNYIFKMAVLWLILQIGNYLRYNRDFLYISVSKVQLCVHGHWIHMQRSYEVNILIILVFWFNPASGIYIKISWWHSCPQLCLLSDNSRYQIWIYNNYIFLPGHIYHTKWYIGLTCAHWKHTSLILVFDYDIFTI